MNQLKDKILIVDDDITNLQVLFKTLQDANYEILVAKDAPSALARLQHNNPDLILLDIMLPGMDGFALYNHLRQEMKSEIPVIFLSAVTDVNAIIAGLQLSAVDYITKPFDPRIVIARIEKHLQLERLRRELKAYNQQLQREVAELDAFAHTVAHDLKGPLAIVLGFADILADELVDYPSANVKQALTYIRTISQKMASIINDLLLLAQIHRQTFILQTIDMQPIVHEALAHLATNIEEYQAMITQPDQWPPVIGYAPWVETVWVNYLSNGLKYGGRPPHLTLGSDLQENGHMRFWVKDNGRGLSPEEQQRLFIEFVRLGQISESPGHGLGLSIVRRIITQLGGDVGVESESGQGSTFYFTLPYAEDTGNK